MRPSIKQTNIAGPTTALACPANMSLRLRSIASRSSSMRISSCSICSTGANPILRREVPCSATPELPGLESQSQDFGGSLTAWPPAQRRASPTSSRRRSGPGVMARPPVCNRSRIRWTTTQGDSQARYGRQPISNLNLRRRRYGARLYFWLSKVKPQQCVRSSVQDFATSSHAVLYPSQRPR